MKKREKRVNRYQLSVNGRFLRFKDILSLIENFIPTQIQGKIHSASKYNINLMRKRSYP